MEPHKDEPAPRQAWDAQGFALYHDLNVKPLEAGFTPDVFYEIFFFLSGDASYLIEGRYYRLRPGDILLTDNRDICRPEICAGGPHERYVIWLNPFFFTRLPDLGDDLATCFADMSGKGYSLIRPDAATVQHLNSLCAYMADVKAQRAFGGAALLHACLIEFLAYLNRAYFDMPDSVRRDASENDQANAVIDYINDHLAEDLSLDRLAGTFYISKSYLSSQFKQQTGLSLYQFIMKKRLAVARDKLRTGASVMDACISCGFGDYSNFLKAFKREFGCNPREFTGSPR